MYCRDLRTHRSLLCLFAKSYSLHLNLNFRNDKAKQWVSKTTSSLKSFQKQILLKKPALIGQRKSFAAVSLSINMWRKCHPAELQEVAGTVVSSMQMGPGKESKKRVIFWLFLLCHTKCILGIKAGYLEKRRESRSRLKFNPSIDTHIFVAQASESIKYMQYIILVFHNTSMYSLSVMHDDLLRENRISQWNRCVDQALVDVIIRHQLCSRGQARARLSCAFTNNLRSHLNLFTC